MIDRNFFFRKISMIIQGALVSSFFIDGGISTAQAMQENEIQKYLPHVIVEQICVFLPADDISRLSIVNKHFYEKTKKVISSKAYNQKLLSFAKDKFFNNEITQVNLLCSTFGKKIDNVSLSLGNWLRMTTKRRENFFAFCDKKDLFSPIMTLAIFPKYSLEKKSWPVAYAKNPQTDCNDRIFLNNAVFTNLYFYEMATFCCKFNKVEELKSILKKEELLDCRDSIPWLDLSFNGIFTKIYLPMKNKSLLAIAKKHHSDKIISYFKELPIIKEIAFEEIEIWKLNETPPRIRKSKRKLTDSPSRSSSVNLNLEIQSEEESKQVKKTKINQKGSEDSSNN